MAGYNEDVYNAAITALAKQLVSMTTSDAGDATREELHSMYEDYMTSAIADIEIEGKEILDKR